MHSTDPAWLSSAAAAAVLGVKLETLYAYVSRRLIRTRATPGRGRLYAADDLARLAARRDARAGHGPVAAGALRWGEPVLDTGITEIRVDGPAYRGSLAVELARAGVAFEDVVALHLFGEPAALDGGRLTPPRAGAPGSRSSAHGQRPRSRELAPARARPERPFDAMIATIAERAVLARAAGDSPEDGARRALELVGSIARAAGVVGPRSTTRARPREAVARTLLEALGGRPGPSRQAAINSALILLADHELNPSTFAARVAASTGATFEMCLLAACATLSGSAHGGATERVEALVDEVGAPEHAARGLRDRLARGASVPGVGHPLYPNGDPRGAMLVELARSMGARSGRARTALAIADVVELAGAGMPNVDLGLVALAAALGLGRGAALAVFATARTAGWLAHVVEQRATGALLRPRARYIGPQSSPGSSRDAEIP